jgi:Fe-Mn family superoxide dismutase
MKHELMKLPFEYDALAPHMSKETLTYHHDKHHQTYVNKLNELIVDTKFEDSDLVEIVKQADGGIFNNAAQVFNHDFFWNSITPKETKMSSELEKKLIANFGSVETFKTEFITKATTHFGAGWAWLVADANGALSIVTTVNAGCPLTAGLTPLLTCDVWEHAYYIDFRNVRPEYLTHWWSLVNWDFVSANTAKI